MVIPIKTSATQIKLSGLFTLALIISLIPQNHPLYYWFSILDIITLFINADRSPVDDHMGHTLSEQARRESSHLHNRTTNKNDNDDERLLTDSQNIIKCRRDAPFYQHKVLLSIVITIGIPKDTSFSIKIHTKLHFLLSEIHNFIWIALINFKSLNFTELLLFSQISLC